jgi:hypothetical protein
LIAFLANFGFDLKLNMTAGKMVEKIRHDRVIPSLNNPSAAAISAPSRKGTRYFHGLLLLTGVAIAVIRIEKEKNVSFDDKARRRRLRPAGHRRLKEPFPKTSCFQNRACG